jgi:hypothetical protein
MSLIVPDRNIIIPKYRDIVMELPRQTVGIAGRYKLRKGKTDIRGVEHITGETAWFNNIITNNGKDNFADADLTVNLAYAHVGTGTTAELATDTQLQTFVAASNTVQDSSSTAQASAPYYGKYVRTIRFGEGVAAGNIAEVAMSTQNTNGDAFTRALVKDGGGSPTTITVLSDEWLDVTYEFRTYPGPVTSRIRLSCPVHHPGGSAQRAAFRSALHTARMVRSAR